MMVVATLSACPLDDKATSSAKAVEANVLIKLMRSMKGAARLACCSKSTFSKFVNRSSKPSTGLWLRGRMGGRCWRR
jgi:hypothetical protein